MARFGKLAMLSGARSLAKRNSAKVHQGIDKMADAVRSRIGEQHAGKIDKGANFAKKVSTGSADDHFDRDSDNRTDDVRGHETTRRDPDAPDRGSKRSEDERSGL